MKMSEDGALLREYVEEGSERAFTMLVERYVNLVYAAALRIGCQDTQLAQDVAQSVFTDFAAKARALPRDAHLGGWLYKHTSFLAANAVRTERRRARERQACEMNAATDDAEAVWSTVSPLLDEAMRHLGGGESRAVVLRFFEQKSFAAIGQTVGISEEAARKRVDRALEKLRVFFARRGLSFSAAVLGSALETYAAPAAPMGLASFVAGAALARAAGGVGAGFSLLKFMILTKTKIGAAMITACLIVAIIMQSQENSRLRRALREEAARLEALRVENERLSQPRVTAASAWNQDQVRELARLRGEVGILKEKLGALKEKGEAKTEIPKELPHKDLLASIEMAKLAFTKQWMLAFLQYASDHQHACPTSFEQAVPYWPQDPNDKLPGLDESNVTTYQFRLLYHGSFTEITNPSETIVIGEAQSVLVPTGWVRAYGFADGHSEFHGEENGNFALWESQHIQAPASQ